MKDGGPAFPKPADSGICRDLEQRGMSLRDYFAAKALNGMLSDPKAEYGITIPEFARDAYRYADAMIQEREEKS